MSEELKDNVIKAISVVNDPHMGVSIVDMGIAQSVDIDGDQVTIVLKPTNPGCMSIARVAAQVKGEAEKVDGIEKAIINIEGHAMAESINEMINK